MPNYTQAIVAIEKYFADNWGETSLVIWGSDDAQQPANAESWVRFNVQHEDGGQASMGSPDANLYRQQGSIIIQIFQQQGQFGVEARTFASNIIDLYHGTTNSGIRYENARINEVGNDGNGWYQINVIVRFEYDTIT